MAAPGNDTKIYEWAFTYSLPIAQRNANGVLAFKLRWEPLRTSLRGLCKKFIFQLELTGADNWHYQGYINLKQKKKKSTLVNALHPLFPDIHVSRCSDAGRKALQEYCLKEDTRQAGPWADKRIYLGADLYANAFPWQAELTAECLKDPDDRTIHWIYDHDGCAGKSKWCKFMAHKHGAGVLAYSKTSDLINFVYKSDATIFVFDLTRAKPLDIGGGDLYAALESIKNGMVFNSKYETGSKLFDPPHVLVFANAKPELDKLSRDRWKMHSLCGGAMYDGLHDAAPAVPVPVLPGGPPLGVNVRGDDLPFNNHGLQYIQPIPDMDDEAAWDAMWDNAHANDNLIDMSQ